MVTRRKHVGNAWERVIDLVASSVTLLSKAAFNQVGRYTAPTFLLPIVNNAFPSRHVPTYRRIDVNNVIYVPATCGPYTYNPTSSATFNRSRSLFTTLTVSTTPSQLLQPHKIRLVLGFG